MNILVYIILRRILYNTYDFSQTISLSAFQREADSDWWKYVVEVLDNWYEFHVPLYSYIQSIKYCIDFFVFFLQ